MPYSEGIGFISDLRDLGPGDIDPVFYVGAHEMAHQYWAHQVIGANMQGAEMLSETYGYQEPPYPTTVSAVRAFHEVMPDSLQYLIEDLFETMAFFTNTRRVTRR